MRLAAVALPTDASCADESDAPDVSVEPPGAEASRVHAGAIIASHAAAALILINWRLVSLLI
jgi:hypothetical protein